MYYSLIILVNKLIKDVITRNRLIKEYNILYFKMEAVGLMNDFPYVVIRGIYNYSNLYKNDT